MDRRGSGAYASRALSILATTISTKRPCCDSSPD
jgi:hypothetical protein